MQSFQALDYNKTDNTLLQCKISTQDLRSIMLGETGHLPSLYFVIKEDLNELINLSKGFITDKNKKNPNKGLSDYFPALSGCYALRASYSKPGRALQGAEALIESVDNNGCKMIFLIGLPFEIYVALKDKANPPKDEDVEEVMDERYIQRQKELLDAGPRVAVSSDLTKNLVGSSDVAWITRKQIMVAARNDFKVLIEGATGTGKEVIAREIHQNSNRSSGQFIVVNCGGIASELFESELFGHVIGAFTSATSNKQGLWTLANDGTLFLDEIGELSLPHQVKVLRALEEQAYYPVGSTKEVKSNARVVAATNRDLLKMVKKGLFRADLYYRLCSFHIRTFSLHLHPEDIPLLAEHFWKNICTDFDTQLSEEVLREFKKWRWPGNARDIRSLLESAYTYVQGNPVTLQVVRNILMDRIGPQVEWLCSDQS